MIIFWQKAVLGFLTVLILTNVFFASAFANTSAITSATVFEPSPTPTSTPSTSTTTSTSSSSNTSTVCSAAKPGSAPYILFAAPANNSVTLTWTKAAGPVTRYLVAYGNTADANQYGNPDAGGPDTTSYMVKGLSRGVTYYFKVKAINDCMPGDFSNVLSAAPTGTVINTTGPTENFVPAAQISRLLFDIKLSIDSPLINNSGDLVARTQFSSFGNVPTPVNMEYRIEDAGSKQVYSEKTDVTVETEQLVTKEFKNLKLVPGKYILILTTTYGDNVRDEFRQAFEVKAINPKQSLPVIPILAIVTCLFIFGLFIYKKRKSG